MRRLSLTCCLFLSQKAGFSVVLFVGPWLLTLLRLSLISVMPGLLVHGPSPLPLPSPIARALASKMHLGSCPQTQAYPIVFHKIIKIGRKKNEQIVKRDICVASLAQDSDDRRCQVGHLLFSVFG